VKDVPYPVYNVSRELPDWLVRGRTQFQNWHAGPVEVAKGVLTFALGRGTNEGWRDHHFSGGITTNIVWQWTNTYSDDFLSCRCCVIRHQYILYATTVRD